MSSVSVSRKGGVSHDRLIRVFTRSPSPNRLFLRNSRCRTGRHMPCVGNFCQAWVGAEQMAEHHCRGSQPGTSHRYSARGRGYRIVGASCPILAPKFGLFAPAREGGTIAARYFIPWKAHLSMAVTGAQCLASCALAPGTVSEGLLERPATSPATVVIEHASGTIDVLVDYEVSETGLMINSAGLVRTARKLADGRIYIPSSVWAGP